MNELQKTTFGFLEILLKYPTVQDLEFITQSNGQSLGFVQEELVMFDALIEDLKSKPIEELEEMYMATFDVQAPCCLDVGYLLFGEDYKRGQFMAHLIRLHRENGVDCGCELPDHLPNILKLIEKLDHQDATSLVFHIVYPALIKMQDSLLHSNSVFKKCIMLTKKVLGRTFDMKDADVPTFLPVLDKEVACQPI